MSSADSTGRFAFLLTTQPRASFQLDSYEVQLKFHVLSFASETRDIVDIMEPESGNADHVVWSLEQFDHLSRTRRRSTSLTLRPCAPV